MSRGKDGLITLKGRGCVLMLVPSLHPSRTLPPFSALIASLPALTFTLWPTLALFVLSAPSSTTPVVNRTTIWTSDHAAISLVPVAVTPKILRSPIYTQTSTYTSVTVVTPTLIPAVYPQISLSATSKTSASPLSPIPPKDIPETSPTAAPKSVPFRLGKPVFLCANPVCRHSKPSPPFRPAKRPRPPLRAPRTRQTPPPPPLLKTMRTPVQKPRFPRPPELPPSPFTPVTLTPKTMRSPSYETSPSPPPQTSMSPVPSNTVRHHPAISQPPEITHKLPSIFREKPAHFFSPTSPILSPNSTSPAQLPTTSRKLSKRLPTPSPPKTAPSHVARPPKHADKFPTPVLTCLFRKSLSFTSKTLQPPPLAKTSPSPLPRTSPPLPKTTPSRQPRVSPPLPALPDAARSLFEGQPFIIVWNIPDLACHRLNVSLDTSPFKGVATPAKVPGQFLSLFYTDRLGLYPRVDQAGGRQIYGGIPQRGNLKASMNKARADISYYIPSRKSRGLAVIDWEEWRPLWDRNWGTKRIYQTLSVAHAMQKDPSLGGHEATAKAKQQFQGAARSFMSETLALGRAMRPNHLWGFYLFPNCYNYGWLEPGYTGQCSKKVTGQNNELLWLWEASTALYPSVYLQASLGDSQNAALMVRNRVQEALRVSTLPRQTSTAPVFVYTRPVFSDQNRHFLSRRDLVSTIGESAAVGASGAILWGASADYNDKASCEALSSYLSSTLNPYITNVTAAAQLCSDFLCHGNGRCVRKNYDSDHYLHLSPGSFWIARAKNRYLVLGRPTVEDLKVFSRRFTCQCYEGLTCDPRKYRELVKDLMFRVKHGLYKKAQTLNKAVLDDMRQNSIVKETVKKNLKV